MTTVRKTLDDISVTQADLQRAAQVHDDQIDLTDSPELTEEHFKNAQRIPAGMSQLDRLEVYRDAQGGWRWRRTAANGRIVGASSQGYKTKAACIQNAVRMTTPFGNVKTAAE